MSLLVRVCLERFDAQEHMEARFVRMDVAPRGFSERWYIAYTIILNTMRYMGHRPQAILQRMRCLCRRLRLVQAALGLASDEVARGNLGMGL